MALEIERKFLVRTDGWREAVRDSRRLCQGYLARTSRVVVRVRIADDAEARITVKGCGSALVRQEFEYDIPVEDARALMQLTLGRVVEKRRHIVPAGDETWEVDVFEGEHAGLVLAEIELDREDAAFARPDWLGEEVTGDERYYNVALAGVSGPET